MTIHPLRAWIEGLGAHLQRERATSQMTLGKLIAALEALPPDAAVANLRDMFSYRGYYCDLCFTRGPGKRPAAELLAACRSAMGAVFEGYKGGDFVMGANTPLWVGEYGRSPGLRLMGLTPDGDCITSTDDA